MAYRYKPPYTITPQILKHVIGIGEIIGELKIKAETAIVPELRRKNRIKTIQASLAIEGNTLSLEQVTAVLAGKRVLGQPRELQEVRNTFAAYEKMSNWCAHSSKDLVAAHGLLMGGLIDEPGCFRSGNVSDQVKRMLSILKDSPYSASEIMSKIGLAHRPTFRKNYIKPALENQFVEMTHPDKPRSKNQRYRITDLGMKILIDATERSKIKRSTF
jgi:hypothetical protein